MGPRAAWRLEALGFDEVYDYAPGKMDWFACGYPRAGAASEVPWAGDLAHEELVKCAPADSLEAVAKAVAASGFDFAVVVDEEGLVAGRLDGAALAKDGNTPVVDVMELGPRTIRPSIPVEELLGKRSSQGVKSWLVSTSHGVYMGVLTRDDAELALERFRRTSEA